MATGVYKQRTISELGFRGMRCSWGATPIVVAVESKYRALSISGHPSSSLSINIAAINRPPKSIASTMRLPLRPPMKMGTLPPFGAALDVVANVALGDTLRSYPLLALGVQP